MRSLADLHVDAPTLAQDGRLERPPSRSSEAAVFCRRCSAGRGRRCSEVLCERRYGASGARGIGMPDVEITIRPSGPYLVRGPIVLRDSSGNQLDLAGKETIALCRCGGSTTKPFCDGTHSAIGFLAAGEAVRDTQ